MKDNASHPGGDNRVKLLVALIFVWAFLAFWFVDYSPRLSLAQAPTITPVIGDIYIHPHHGTDQPTPTSTRIPDDEPPVTTLVIQPTANMYNWYHTPITLTFEAPDNMTGPAGTWHKFAGESEWQMYEYYYPPVTITTEGVWTLVYYSEDANRNAETVHTTTLKIDLTPPTITHTVTGARRPDGWFNWPVIVTLKGQDALSGLDHYEVNLNNTGWLTVTTSYTVTAAGYHRLAYRAIDQASNVSTVQTVAFGIGEPKNVYLPFILKR